MMSYHELDELYDMYIDRALNTGLEKVNERKAFLKMAYLLFEKITQNK